MKTLESPSFPDSIQTSESAGKATITASECIPLTRVPEKALQEELLEGYDALVRLMEKAFPESDASSYRIMTAKSHVLKTDVERPRSLRAKRTELVQDIYTKKRTREDVLSEAHARDEIVHNYITKQREVTVDMSEYGKVSVRCLYLKPPEACINEKNKDLPPVVLLGGWGADIAGMESAIQELSYQGREVIFISQPDSQFGFMDDKFVKSVKESSSLAPHAAFFKNASKELVKLFCAEDTKFELWGLSAGAMEAATMLSDPEYADLVSNAVLIAPAGSSKLGALSQAKGYLSEIENLIKAGQKAAYYSYVSGRRDETGFDLEVKEKQYQGKQRKFVVWPKILELARQELPIYNTARVRENGNILVVTGEKDVTVESSKRFSSTLGNGNPQITVLENANWGHGDLIYNPEGVIKDIHEKIHPETYK